MNFTTLSKWEVSNLSMKQLYLKNFGNYFKSFLTDRYERNKRHSLFVHSDIYGVSIKSSKWHIIITIIRTMIFWIYFKCTTSKDLLLPLPTIHETKFMKVVQNYNGFVKINVSRNQKNSVTTNKEINVNIIRYFYWFRKK